MPNGNAAAVPVDRAERRDREQHDAGPLLLGAGVLGAGFGAYLLLRHKPATVPPPPPVNGTPSPTPVAATCPHPVDQRPALPAYWPGLDTRTRLGVATFYALLGRFPGAPPLGDVAWIASIMVGAPSPTAGIQALSTQITYVASQELVDLINTTSGAVCDAAGAPECIAADGSSVYASAWVSAAYCVILNRWPDTNGAKYWLGQWTGDLNVREHLVATIASGTEFVSRVTSLLSAWGG